MRKHIPNAITCCNLLCGCAAVMFAFNGDYSTAYAAIVAGAVFDFFDGFAARLLGVSSPIGKELDSLADDITFGLAPATILYSIMRACEVCEPACYAAFLVSAFSALRLAKFNLDERQTLGFIGLPTPANALFIASLALLLSESTLPLTHPQLVFAALMLLVPLSCWLLVSEVPMFALKFKHYTWKGNELRLLFMAFSLAMLIVLGWSAFSIIVPAYILVSLLALRR